MMRQHQRQNQMGNQMFGRMDQINGQKMQYNQNNQVMRQRDNQMMGARDNQMRNEHGYNMFDRMIQQRQDNNQREFMRHQDGRLNNFYSYERMLQRQNEARNKMNNRGRFDNNQHRMFK